MKKGHRKLYTFIILLLHYLECYFVSNKIYLKVKISLKFDQNLLMYTNMNFTISLQVLSMTDS